ncbi:MAG: AtpZ/AtpI family protein [Deltaproteobacteria bacterium]|nr:AtpZ/AtpI family protein [Deltaproteobacteria bacterium]
MLQGRYLKISKDKRDFYRNLYTATTIGFSVVFSVLIGGAIGYLLDRWFPSLHPWLFFIFLFFGIVAGFENMYRGFKKLKKNDNDKKT